MRTYEKELRDILEAWDSMPQTEFIEPMAKSDMDWIMRVYEAIERADAALNKTDTLGYYQRVSGEADDHEQTMGQD